MEKKDALQALVLIDEIVEEIRKKNISDVTPLLRQFLAKIREETQVYRDSIEDIDSCVRELNQREKENSERIEKLEKRMEKFCKIWTENKEEKLE